MSNAIVMDESFKGSRDSVVRESPWTGRGYDRSPNLIRCNNGYSCECMVSKKHFFKTGSNDSGGSFDCLDNADTPTVSSVNSTTLVTSIDDEELNNSIKSENCKTDTPALDVTNSTKYLDNYFSEKKRKMRFSLINEEVDICEKNDDFRSEVVPGVVISTSSEYSARNSPNISHIFSKLAKNLVPKKTLQICEISECVTAGKSLTEHAVEKFCEVNGNIFNNSDTFIKTRCYRDRGTSTTDKNRSGVSGKWENADLNTTLPNCEHIENYCDLGGVQDVPEIGRSRHCMKRSMSDSGSSTGSNELSDGERISLNGSKSSADVRKSVLSLDLGISIASLESLGEKNLTDIEDCSEDFPRLQKNMSPAASDNDLRRTTLESCLDSFLTRNQRPLDTLSAADDEIFSIQTETDTGGTDLCPESLRSNESGARVEFFLQEILDRNCSNTSKEVISSENTQCPASTHTTQSSPAICVKKKRDFHIWEHDFQTICQDSQDFNNHQYLNSEINGGGESGTLISMISAIDNETTAVVLADNSKNSLPRIPDPCMINKDFILDELSSEQTDGSNGNDKVIQINKTDENCTNKNRVRRVGVCGSSNSTNGFHPRDLQHVPKDTAASKNTSIPPSTVCTSNIPNCLDIQSDITDINALKDVCETSEFSTGSTLNSAVPADPNSTDCDTNCTSKQGLQHTNCLKTVGTAFRRMSSQNKSFQLPNIFSSNKCKYDLELASNSSKSTPAKSDRQRRLMQMFSSSKSSSFSSATLCKVTSHLTDFPSVSVTPESSPAMLTKRFRSYSVDACSTASRQFENSNSAKSLQDNVDTQLDAAGQLENTSFENGSILKELDDDLLHMDQAFDAKKAERNKLQYPYNGSEGRPIKKAQQFGLSLNDIKNNTGRIIPLPVEETVEFLKTVGGDEVEGLFRRCARVTTMKEVQEKYDDGENIDFAAYGDPHLAAAILKKFLRELQEPLMTYDLFEPITRLHYLETNKQLTEVQRILQDELPEDNYIILKYVFQFLRQVVSKSDINHMTSENIATVFGPNIAWPKGQANLAAVEQAVKFALILVQNFDDVFLR